MKTVILAAMTAAVALSAPAFAQDGSTFVGPRAEAIVGYDAVKTNSNGLGTPDGFLYGVGLGYDFNLGGLVAGVEAEIADSTTKRTLGNVTLESDRDIYVGGRIGAPLGDTALLYAKAGYTNARLEGAGFGGNGDGVRLGAGLEYKLAGNLFVKGEYRYSNYQDDVERHQVVGGLGLRF
ncbi:MAG: porin family protein [Sphingomonadales bacterium]|nr:porin family protein [Sphingomonadales bacterium]